jgi:dienelactone hydrolase
MRAAASVIALALFVGRADAGDLPDAKQKALRELLTKVLAEADPGARKSLAAGATALAGDAPIADVVALVRKGPLLQAGEPKPRKVAGRTEELSSFGKVVVGFTFESGGATYRYAVDVPPGYDPREPTGLLLDPGHGEAAGKPDRDKAGYLGMWRGFCDDTGRRDWLVARTEIVEEIGAGGRRGTKPEDEILVVFDAFFRDLFSRFAVDPDRVVVSGISQTGFWAWQLGLFRADRFAATLPMSAVTNNVDRFAANLIALPVIVLHGDVDPTCPVAQPRKSCALLARMGVDVRYREVAGAAHDVAAWQHLPEEWKAATKARVRYPRRVSKAVRGASGPWCSWLRIDDLDERKDDEPPAGVDGVVDGQTVRVHSDGVKALTVGLSGDMLDLGKPVEIVWNGKKVHAGVVKPSAATLFELAGDKCDWAATLEASVPLRR